MIIRALNKILKLANIRIKCTDSDVEELVRLYHERHYGKEDIKK